MWDLTRPIAGDANINFYKWDSEEGKHAFWHSSAHLLAEALQELYPGIQFGIGPAIENGFYYDVVPANGENIKESDFPKIEKKMLELAREKQAIVRRDVPKDEVLKEFAAKGQTFKCELIPNSRTATFRPTHRVASPTSAVAHTSQLPHPSRRARC
jgi:threonyl-tRNA synthetase